MDAIHLQSQQYNEILQRSDPAMRPQLTEEMRHALYPLVLMVREVRERFAASEGIPQEQIDVLLRQHAANVHQSMVQRANEAQYASMAAHAAALAGSPAPPPPPMVQATAAMDAGTAPGGESEAPPPPAADAVSALVPSKDEVNNIVEETAAKDIALEPVAQPEAAAAVS